MNFNVYLRKNVGDRITKAAKILHRSRNSIVSEAIEEWLKRHSSSSWPKNFFNFEPIENVPDFKKLRKDLKNLFEDPLE